MKNVFLIGILVIIVIIVIIFISKSYTNMNLSNSANPTDKEATTTNNISIKNFSFNPQTLIVKTGTTVTWTNNDSTIHSVKSSLFNSAGLSTDDTFKYTFNTIGTFNYNCGIHPTMTGMIIVQ